jgi:hypothetical protein
MRECERRVLCLNLGRSAVRLALLWFFETAARQLKRYRVYSAILSKNPFMGEDLSVPAEGKSRQSHTAATRIDPKKDLSLAF